MNYIDFSQSYSNNTRHNILMHHDVAEIVQRSCIGGCDIEAEYNKVISWVILETLKNLVGVEDESQDLLYQFTMPIGSTLVKIDVEVVDDDETGSSITTTINLGEVIYVD
jgi:hypothetical protein